MREAMLRDVILQIPLTALITPVVLIFFVPTFIVVIKKHSHKIAIVSTNVGGFLVVLVLTSSYFVNFGAQFFRIGMFFAGLFQFFLETGIYFAALFWLFLLIWSFVDPQKSAIVSTVSKSVESSSEKNAGSN